MDLDMCRWPCHYELVNIGFIGGRILVVPHISVAHGLSYTLSNCMRHERAKRSECAHAVRQGVAEAMCNSRLPHRRSEFNPPLGNVRQNYCKKNRKSPEISCTTHLKLKWGVHYTSWPKGVVHGLLSPFAPVWHRIPIVLRRAVQDRAYPV